MRRLFRLKNRKILAGPYLLAMSFYHYSSAFMILYHYGLTDKNGSFTEYLPDDNENLKALGLALTVQAYQST